MDNILCYYGKPEGGLGWLIILISRFNVDCSSAAQLYGGAEGAFGVSDGSDGSDGSELQCAAPAREQCQGAVSNCWSPGQRDTGQVQS